MLNEKAPVFHTKQISIKTAISASTVPETLENEVVPIATNSVIRERPLISFFPEGGDLVSGLISVIGIKATTAKGNGIALKGDILDESDQVVSTFETYDLGLGKGTFIPDINKNHRARVIVNGKEEIYPLPIPVAKGYTLSSRDTDNFLVIDLATNVEEGLNGSMLVGHVKGEVFFQRIEKSKGKKYTVKLFTDKMKDGVAHFTLFTATGEPVCERLVFIDNPLNDLKLSINANKSNYSQREKVSLNLAIDHNGKEPILGNLTASVIAAESISANAPSTIKS